MHAFQLDDNNVMYLIYHRLQEIRDRNVYELDLRH